MSKTTILHVHHAFLYISLPSLHNYDVKWPLSSAEASLYCGEAGEKEKESARGTTPARFLFFVDYWYFDGDTQREPLRRREWNDQNLSLLGTGNGKAINSTISVRTGARSSLFSSSQNPLPLSNRTNWDNREKVWNDPKSVFQRRFMDVAVVGS